MYHQSKKVLLFFAAAVLFTAFPLSLRSAQFASPVSYAQAGKGDPELSITKTSSTAVSLRWSWNTTNAPASYRVTITDLTTSTVLRSITTSSTSETVTGLTPGHTYQFAVQADSIIIMDTTMV